MYAEGSEKNTELWTILFSYEHDWGMSSTYKYVCVCVRTCTARVHYE